MLNVYQVWFIFCGNEDYTFVIADTVEDAIEIAKELLAQDGFGPPCTFIDSVVRVA